MIPNTKDRSLVSRGVEVSAEFGISKGDEAHLMQILRDTLYSDKVLAVLREYSSNAWDAHREVGKADLPIKVTLPTFSEQTLSIRDFGPGLSPDDVFHVYTQYGASTKRGTDNAVGMLGIGSKSGFAYSDTFTVISFNGGKKRTYVAVLDKTDRGLINLLNEEDCGSETGVEIQIAVRQQDIREFTTTAVELFKYFIPRPDINTEIPPLPVSQKSFKNGILWTHRDENGEYVGHHGWVAVMGCVPYRIDLDQIRGFGDGIANFVNNLSGALFFNIGEIQINAAREGVKYTDETKTVLVTRINALIEEYVSDTLVKITSGCLTPWEKRMRAQVLNQMTRMVPEVFKDLLKPVVKLPPSAEITTFYISRWREYGSRRKENKSWQTVDAIPVVSSMRLVIKDDVRSLKGFSFQDQNYLVRRHGPQISTQAVEVELAQVLDKIGITGIPIDKTSELPWSKSIVNRLHDPKYRRKVFRVKEPLDYVPSKKSEAWEPEQRRKPAAGDIFVILSEFESLEGNFLSKRCWDEKLGKQFHVILPPVYGYRTTESKPINETANLGTPYLTWRKKFFRSLVNAPSVKEELDNWFWANVIDYGYTSDHAESYDKNAFRTVAAGLGLHHEITEFVRLHLRGRSRCKFIRESREELLKTLAKFLEDESEWCEAYTAFTSIACNYPLLSLSQIGMEELWRKDAEKWLNYIKLVDRSRLWTLASRHLLSPTTPLPSSGEEEPTISGEELPTSQLSEGS